MKLVDLFRWLMPSSAPEIPENLNRSQIRLQSAEVRDKLAFMKMQELRMQVDPRPDAKRTVEPSHLEDLDALIDSSDALVRRMLGEEDRENG